MKVISYSIFRAPCEKFEFMAYLRGIYFNWRMNNLIYPDWKMYVTISRSIQNSEYNKFFIDLKANGVWVDLHEDAPLCRSMLERMYPVLMSESVGITHVLCRDADALTSYREAQSVNLWIKSGKDAHVIHDNPAHGGLMGGMVGFRTEAIRKHFNSLNALTEGWDLSKRGSDQHLLNKRILPFVKDSLYTHDLQGYRPTGGPGMGASLNVDKRLWESNLCSAFIGSAGVNEMETLRFFKRFDKTDYSEFEKEHSEICYWAR